MKSSKSWKIFNIERIKSMKSMKAMKSLKSIKSKKIQKIDLRQNMSKKFNGIFLDAIASLATCHDCRSHMNLLNIADMDIVQ